MDRGVAESLWAKLYGQIDLFAFFFTAIIMTFILTTLVSCLIVPLKLSRQLNVAFVVNCGVFQITENAGRSSQQPFCLSDSKLLQLELGRVIGSDVGSGQRVLLTHVPQINM